MGKPNAPFSFFPPDPPVFLPGACDSRIDAFSAPLFQIELDWSTVTSLFFFLFFPPFFFFFPEPLDFRFLRQLSGFFDGMISRSFPFFSPSPPLYTVSIYFSSSSVFVFLLSVDGLFAHDRERNHTSKETGLFFPFVELGADETSSSSLPLSPPLFLR